MKITFIINGSRKGQINLKESIEWIPKQYLLNLKVYYSKSVNDFKSYISNEIENGVNRVIIGGGDGTLNITINTLLRYPQEKRPEVAVIPLGTANDFANSALIPQGVKDALTLAINGEAYNCDIGQVNQRYFLNVATLGFGATITTQTPPQLKEIFGSGAYAISGLLRLFEFQPTPLQIEIDNLSFKSDTLSLAVCNATQAGGGVVLAPEATIDDGYFDFVFYSFENLSFSPYLTTNSSLFNSLFPFKKILKVKNVTFKSLNGNCQINLDGEPYIDNSFTFHINSKAIKIVLPNNTPIIGEEL